jgi:hypothetical protein
MLQRGPAHFGAQGLQGFDQHGGLDGHVQAARDAGALRAVGPSANSSRMAIRPGISVSAMLDFLAAPVGQRQVGDGVAWFLMAVQYSVHGSLQKLL